MSSEIPGSSFKEDRKHKVLRQPRRAMRDVCVPSVNRSFSSVESQWFIKYVRDELRGIYDSCIAEVTKGFGAVKLLGSDV